MKLDRATKELMQEILYAGLKQIWNSEFPKTCARCGKVYAKFEDYIKETRSLAGGSGMMSYDLDEERDQVGVFRNCICGTTITAFCMDRRDVTKAGLQRRHLFGELMDRLIRFGLTPAEARQQLLSALRKGEMTPPSPDKKKRQTSRIQLTPKPSQPPTEQ